MSRCVPLSQVSHSYEWDNKSFWYKKAPELGGVSLQLIYQVRLDVDVYGSVPGEGPATLFVPAEAADKVGILHLVV